MPDGGDYIPRKSYFWPVALSSKSWPINYQLWYHLNLFLLFSCITPYWLELPLPQEVPEQVGLYKNKVRRRLQLLKCYCDSTKFCLICCFASVTFAPFLNQIPDFKEDHNSNWNQYQRKPPLLNDDQRWINGLSFLVNLKVNKTIEDGRGLSNAHLHLKLLLDQQRLWDHQILLDHPWS